MRRRFSGPVHEEMLAQSLAVVLPEQGVYQTRLAILAGLVHCSILLDSGADASTGKEPENG